MPAQDPIRAIICISSDRSTRESWREEPRPLQIRTSFIVPGANLRSVGTIRDAKKWPQRDGRTDAEKLDCINYNLLSPFTIQKMLSGIRVLEDLKRVSGEISDTYTYQSGKIRNSSLKNGLKLYNMAIDKFLGNSLITRIMNADVSTLDCLRRAFQPDSEYGDGDWVDIAGMIAPKNAITDLLDDVESGKLSSMHDFNARIHHIHSRYYDYEWRWAYNVMAEQYGLDLQTADSETLVDLVAKWRESVVGLDNMIYEDARKEFSLSMMASFGADGGALQRKRDFIQVRGSKFESDPFVCSVKEHISVKSALGDAAKDKLRSLH